NLAHQLPVKLTSSNFLLWKTQFTPMVYACGLNHHIDGSKPMPTQFLDDTNTKPNPDYMVWLREDQLVLSWIVVSVSESILPQLVGATTARAAWDKLVAAYASGSKPLIRDLKMQLHTLHRDNANIESYVQKAKGIVDKLAALQHPIPNDDLVEFVLAGLRPAYRTFTRSLESRQEDISFDALYGLLLNEERQLKRDEAHTVIAPTAHRGRGRSSNQGFTQSSQNRGFQNFAQTNTPSQASTMSGIIYHNCEGKGHLARVRPSPRINTGNKASGPHVSNLARTSSAQDWLMDSGTTHHLTADLNNLGIHSEYQGPEEVTLGNGSKLPISHVGKSSVIISDKKFTLDVILHVPNATQNLLSISSFTKSNQVSIEFFPNHFLIKDLATR
ncbi:hypothetical protein A4A49_61418, partial [Nicotiana attenuata]